MQPCGSVSRPPAAGRRPPLPAAVAAAVVWLAAAGPGAARAQGPNRSYAREPPEQIVTAEACGECHLAEYEVWKGTPHATGFRTLHRKQQAEAIARKLGLRLIKRDSPCLGCHYTPVVEDGELRAASGVSCESCHGAGRGWINLHNDYGEGYDRATEPAAHRRRRIEASRAAGMRRPSDLYALAATCFGCHNVPDEELVNVGGHPAGSVGFELVAWSQGEIRHNFLAAQAGGPRRNRERTAVEKRTLYVVGRAMDLEASLRALAVASGDGVYSKAMIRRVRMALVEVRKILGRASLPAIAEVEGIVRRVKAVPGNRAELLAAAAGVRGATERFLAGHDPASLASLDPLVLGIAEPAVELAAGGAGEEAPAAGPGAAGGPAPPPASSASGPPGAGSAGAAGAARRGRPAVGAFKRRIRPPSEHQTLGPGACGGCHEVPNGWWLGDPHYRSAEPFFERRPANVKISRLYGVDPAQMTRGDQVCMDCHGTVVSGNESFEVFDGVSCESCHGPAKDYREPHKEGDKALGLERPGYRAGLRLGMTELRDLAVRAGTCSGCHYVTEPRLISAGHPSGKDFDYLGGMAKVRHWQHPPAAAGALRAAFDAALAARGAVPEVALAELADEDPGAAVAEPGGGRLAAATGAAWNRPRPAAGPAGRVAPAGPPAVGPAGAVGPLELPPFPTIDASTALEDLLLILKRRLELLYRAVAPAAGGEP